MKINLTPELAYLIGLWSKRRSDNGIGIQGNPRLCEIFLKQILELKLVPPEKIKLGVDDKIFFYHSAYEKFFQKVQRESLEIFREKNDKAAAYIAGVFDAMGGTELVKGKKLCYLANATLNDEMILSRLNFHIIKHNKKLFVLGDDFRFFIGKFQKYP
ncbi:Uncharacterised protein [Candidatus Gugararchaeum adminiculabundum]|nr:Uncharacterised protein [Candidatus Gugararchaeum adminiculabundum]